jgi:hypothetical protein
MSAIANLERATWDGRVMPSRSDIRRLLDAYTCQKEALETIVEYWNRNRNDSAMHDACWYAINEAEGALSAASLALDSATLGDGE